MSISAKQIVNIIPGVIGTGGQPLELNGLLVSNSSTIPSGGVTSWATPESVSDYFGSTSDEAALAEIYFLGYINSITKPSTLYIGQFVGADSAAWLRGAAIDNTLAELQAITAGTLTISIDGVSYPLTGVDFSAETSFSEIAAVLQADLITSGATGVTVTYESDFEAFLITSPTTGSTSVVSFPASGDLIPFLKLAEDDGAVQSDGIDERTISENMDAYTNLTQNWATFMHIFDQTNDEKIEFAQWANSKNLGVRYVYSTWDSSATAKDTASTTNLAYLIGELSLVGTVLNYNVKELAAFVLAFGASLKFSSTEGRATMAFKRQGGLAISVDNDTDALGLITNGYNFYGDYATANDRFIWYYNGTITGDYKFLDTHLNAIYLNNAFQLAFMSLFQGSQSIPYNQAGYDLIRAAATDPINAALNFGSIRIGVALSEAQAAGVNRDAGINISGIIVSRGYYLQILDASAQDRGNRLSPPMKFWYTDGGSIQKIEMQSNVIR